MPEVRDMNETHRTMKVRELRFGAEGVYPICISVMAEKEAALYAQLDQIKRLEPDMVEWRADYFQGAEALCADPARFGAILERAREILKDTVLLFTCRTAAEGGQIELPPLAYRALCVQAAKQPQIDMLDVELMREGALAAVRGARNGGKPAIVASYHDFAKTPEDGVVSGLLERMQRGGADICKLAVMPQSQADVARLLRVTRETDIRHDGQALLMTISMGALGTVSRIEGKRYGSCFTFASADGQGGSAPGQLSISELRKRIGNAH